MLTRTLVIVAFALLAPVGALSQDLAPRMLLDGRVTMLIPVGFEPMSQEMLAAKYARARPPKLVLTNPDGSVNVAFRHTPTQVSPHDIPQVHVMAELTFQQQFPTAQWRNSETSERDGMRYFTLDVMTPAVDTDIRNIMFGTPLDGRMLLISFNCTRELDAKWGPIGQQIIDSIIVAGG